METIGERLVILRKALGLTQDSFALIFGITRQGVSNMEKGKSDLSSLQLLNLSNKTSVNITWLIIGNY